MTPILKRIVQLRRLSRSTTEPEEYDTAEREIRRLSARHKLDDATITAALEDGDGPYQIDAGTYGVATPAIAELLREFFGDEILREGAGVVARANRRSAAQDAAHRHRYLAVAMGCCAKRRELPTKSLEPFYCALAAALLEKLRNSEQPRWHVPRPAQPATDVPTPEPAPPVARKAPEPVRVTPRKPGPQRPEVKRGGARPSVQQTTDTVCDIPDHLLVAGLEDSRRIDVGVLFAPEPRRRKNQDPAPMRSTGLGGLVATRR